MKKSLHIVLFSIILLSVFLTEQNTAIAQFGGKSSFSTLIPTATMRDPQMESKDLDSCFSAVINTSISLVSGGGSGSGCSLDSLARIVSQQVAGTEFQSMMNMVGEGFFGDTAFLTNQQSYYHDVNKEITDNFIRGVTADNLPNMIPSFVNQIRAQLISEQNSQYQTVLNREDQGFPGGEEGLEAFKKDWNSCPGGNGWVCFDALLEPQNDPFVAKNIIGENLAKTQREGLQQSKDEVIQGNGFLSIKTDCPKSTDGTENHWVGCNVATPGTTLKDQTNTYLSSSLEQIGQADELDEAIIATAGGLFDAVTSWLLNKSLIKSVKPRPIQQTKTGITTDIACGYSKNTCKGYVNDKAVTFSNSTITDTGYTWDCTSNISCQTDFAVKAKCGSFNNSCETGGRLEDEQDNDLKFYWNCRGSDNLTEKDDSLNCYVNKGIVGPMACGTNYNTCINGTSTPLTDLSHWTCSNTDKTVVLYCPI